MRKSLLSSELIGNFRCVKISLIVFSVFLAMSFSTVLADGSLTTIFTISGHYDVVTGSVSLRDQDGNQSGGDIELDIPGLPRKAYLYWSGFDFDPGGDNALTFCRGAESPVTLVADHYYGPDPWWIQMDTYHYVYRKEITSYVRQGYFVYHIEDLSMRYHYGACIVAVYEEEALPVKDIQIKDGLDAAYWKYEPPRGPESEVTSVIFPPATEDRLLTFYLMVGGIINDSRLNSIWHQAGAGLVPNRLVDEATAVEIGPIPPPLGIPEPNHRELDVYCDTLTIHAGDEYAAFQIESVGDVPGYYGASLVWMVLASVLETAPNELGSVSGVVWADANQNGIREPGEYGIEGVTVRLRRTGDDIIADIQSTAEDGHFTFSDVQPGDYLLEFVPLENYFITLSDQGGDDEVDSDPHPESGRTPSFVVMSNDFISNVDCGMVPYVISDLGIESQVDKAHVNIGEMVTFTLTVWNSGPDSAFGVQVRDELPSGLLFVDAVPTVNDGFSPPVWNLDLPPVPPNNTVEITLVAQTANILGAMDNNAFVSCENRDPDMSNNSSTVSIHNYLPVELYSFTATDKNGRIVLEWITQTETENSGFNILRSESEEGPYIRINTDLIAGEGNSQVTKSYRYVDTSVEEFTTYHYQLQDIAFDGSTSMHGPVYARVSSPARCVLHQNYPNPFNPDTRIVFSLKQGENCELSIFNVNGQLVRKLISGRRNAGIHLVIWDGRDEDGRLLPSGIYLYRLSTRSFSTTRKMGFLR